LVTLTRNVSQYDLSEFVWNFGLLGFCGIASQVMENWCYEPEALALFAKHYETGEVIPQEYVEK
jgi:hypothetical protein